MSTTEQYDVIVAGLGAMGSAALYHSAKQGANVLGIDRYTPPHPFGSTHGDTRITRVAIGEGEAYVPLVQRSHQLWRQLEEESGQELLVQCGGVISSHGNGKGQHGISDFLGATIGAAETYNIEHQLLDNTALRQRLPMFHFQDNETGYFEPSAGFVYPERCVDVQLQLAASHNADMQLDTTILSFDSTPAGVTVHTNRGVFHADQLILSVGPWMNELLPDYRELFRTYRQVLYWFDITDKSQYQQWQEMPVFIWEFGQISSYGFPAIDGPNGGMKIACENYDTETTPGDMDRMVTPQETQLMYDTYVRDQIPGLNSRCIKAATCLYTVTPDHAFIIDQHPQHPNITVVSPCSGHGFKHSAAIGEAASQLALHDISDIDLSAFNIDRFLN